MPIGQHLLSIGYYFRKGRDSAVNINTTGYGYANINMSSKSAQTYIDKFDKSLKLPFFSAMLKTLPTTKPIDDDEIKTFKDDKKIVLKQVTDDDDAAYIIEPGFGASFTQSSMKK